MDIKFCSFNCRGFNISKVKHISELMKQCDILLVQETWCLPSNVGKLNQYFIDLNTYGISSVNDKVLLSGRPHGGCSFLYKKSLSASIAPIDIDCNRVCCMKLSTSIGHIYLYNVYMPCDASNNMYLQQYNEILSHISIHVQSNDVKHCIVAGDLNTDFARHNSGNTVSLNTFIDTEGLYSVVEDYKQEVKYTYTGINSNTSLIDHFLVSANIVSFISKYRTCDSSDNLSDHIPLFCDLDICIVDLPNKIDETCIFNSKPLWHSAKDVDIEAYKRTLDDRLQLCSLNSCIITNSMPCVCDISHVDAISNFHDYIIDSCKIAMTVHIPHTNSTGRKVKVIPGWDYETDCAREESLLSRRIWLESGKPNVGVEYDNMKQCRASYHYLLRSLKTKIGVHVKQSVSKNMLQSNNRNYWKNAEIIRKKNFNTVPVIDGTQGDAAIADLFKDKYSILYNSVPSSSEAMDYLHERIRHAIETQCDANAESSLHTHSVSTADVIKAVKRLKTDKYNDDGIIMSNNFQHGTSLLYTRIAQLFSAMLYYGYAPQLFLRSTMIPIPKGGKVCSTNADLYRSIAISSILSKILDYVIIDQQSDSLCTSDYQFGFKSHSSTMLCSTMLIETIQYYDENGRQPLYVLFLDARKAFDRVCYSELFNILLDKKVCPRIVQLLCYMYLNQACCVKWNSKNSSDFTVSNGVKQGAVISPILFSAYMDILFKQLKHNGIGCHVGPVYAGAFGYADDV